WTYEVFGTGRPNTAIFHSRTDDNPFLPADFHGNVRAQYTSTLAAQELEGKFIDPEGTMFKREWFQVVKEAPKNLRRRGGWDLASRPRDDVKARDPDYTAGVLLGKDGNGDHYILDVRRLRGTPQQVQALVQATAEEDGRSVAIWFEQEP